MFKNNFFLSIYKYEWGIERLITHYIMLRGFAQTMQKAKRLLKANIIIIIGTLEICKVTPIPCKRVG